MAQILSQSCISPKTESDETCLKRYTLYNASLTSRTLNRIAEPLLYRTINLQHHKLDRLILLLQCLVLQPKLGLHVRELRTGDLDRLEEIIYSDYWAPFIAELRNIVRRSPFHFVLRQNTCEGLGGELSYPYVTALLILCKNLVRWSFILRELEDDEHDELCGEQACGQAWEAQLKGRLSPGFPLHQLREVVVDEGTYELTDLGQLYWRFALPSLRSLKAYRMRIDEDTWFGSSKTYAEQAAVSTFKMSPQELDVLSRRRLISNVRHLDLPYMEISVAGLQRLFDLCPSLESLKILWADYGDEAYHFIDMHYPEGPELDFPGIGNVLRTRGRSLRVLHLHIEDFSPPSYIDLKWQDFDMLPPLGSLVELESLEELSVDKVMLTGQDGSPVTGRELQRILPRSLTSLEVTDYSNTVDEAFCAELEALRADEGREKLRTVCISKGPTDPAE